MFKLYVCSECMMEYKELVSDIYIINLQDKGEGRGHILVS